MKRFIFIMATLSQLCMHVRSAAQGQCLPRWYIGHTIVGGNDTRSSFTANADTIIAGDEIWLTISSQLICTGECSLQYPETFTWIHNGDTVSSANYLAEDTGLFIGIIRYSGCVSGVYRMNLHVHQAKAVEENTAQNSESTIEFYPTVSTGIFNVKSGIELTKVQIRNSSGNLVFNSDHGVSTVDISHLQEGLYFYYVEDKLRHVQRGKLFKR